MKIYHVISTLAIGGAERFVTYLANEQAKNNEVSIIILRNIKDQALTFEKDVHTSVGLVKMNWNKKHSMVQALRFTKFLKKSKPQIVHVHLNNPLYYVYFSSFFTSEIKFIHTMHNNLAVWDKIIRIINIFRLINNKITHVCLSDSIYYEAINKYPELKFSMIYNGIPEYYQIRSDEEIVSFWKKYTEKNYKYRFLSIGNLIPAKNFTFMAEVFKYLDEKDIPACLVIIGEDRDPEKKETGRILNAGAENVFLAGPHKDAADFLSVADALLMSSLFEGMPIVVLEAFSMGKPVISTPAGGVSDIIKNSENGYLLDNWDSVSFANKIIEFISLNEEKKSEMGEKAYQFFKDNLQIRKIAENYCDLYLNKFRPFQ